jgi:hypothetical protein
MGCVIAIKIGDIIYVIDEFYGCLDAKELGGRIIAKYGTNVTIASDAMGSHSNRQILKNIGLKKIIDTRVNPRRIDRYANVNANFKNALGNIKLYIHPQCKVLREDLIRLVFKDGTDKPDTQGEKFGHISDGLGYLLEYISPYAGRDTGYTGNNRFKLKNYIS